eukprot:6212273-Pleurochrysis_carterae.AAC.5
MRMVYGDAGLLTQSYMSMEFSERRHCPGSSTSDATVMPSSLHMVPAGHCWQVSTPSSYSAGHEKNSAMHRLPASEPSAHKILKVNKENVGT